MAFITLTTDFGLYDEYVGVVKGVISSINFKANIIDITHNIEPYDINRAAYVLLSAYKYFPKHTVHVVIVDPGVGSDRSIIAVKTVDYIFIAPDNGVLTSVMEKESVETIVKVNNPKYFFDVVSNTFHGRDIFAPVAAHISKGVKIESVGALLDKHDLVYLNMSKPSILFDNEMIGHITCYDNFGNIITNITKLDIDRFCGDCALSNIKIIIGNKIIKGLSKSYNISAFNQVLAIIGSRGNLEIALNQGNAKNYFSLSIGEMIKIVK